MAKKEHLLSAINSAFDNQSGGMGVHLYAVDQFSRGQPLPSQLSASLRGYDCNFLRNGYVWIWTDPENWRDDKEFGPNNRHPNSESYIRFQRQTSHEYERLEWEQMRFMLGGEEGLQVEDPGAPIGTEVGADSMWRYLGDAKQRGLAVYPGNFPPTVKPTNSLTELAINNAGLGLRFSSDIFEMNKTLFADDRFRDRFLTAGVHKLGCMLVLTDQLVYDGKQSGEAVPATYKPSDQFALMGDWSKLYNTPPPTLEELFNQAKEVFIRNTKPDDVLGQEILRLDPTPNFA